MDRKLYSTLALVAVFIGLLGFVFLFEKDKTSKEDQKDNTGQEEIYVLQVSPDDVSAIKITSEEKTFSFNKIEGSWQFDGEGELNQNFIDGLFANIFESKSTVYFNADNLDEYGLGSPSSTFEFQTTFGTTEKISIGNEAPGDRIYVQANDGKKIIVVSRDRMLQYRIIDESSFLLSKE